MLPPESARSKGLGMVPVRPGGGTIAHAVKKAQGVGKPNNPNKLETHDVGSGSPRRLVGTFSSGMIYGSEGWG